MIYFVKAANIISSQQDNSISYSQAATVIFSALTNNLLMKHGDLYKNVPSVRYETGGTWFMKYENSF